MSSPASDLDVALVRAAIAIQNCDALLICTGAGMGVDSGLGTFRGRNAGVWPPLKALQIDFSEISCPDWFDDDPRLAWAFWRFRHQAYTTGEPHAGYALLAKWGAAAPRSVFSVTSNIDGHWVRTRGIGDARTLECHGTVEFMQRVDEHEGRVWRADSADVASMEVPPWDLAPGDDVEVVRGSLRAGMRASHGEWSRARVGADGFSIVDSAGRAQRVTAVRRPAMPGAPPGPDLCRVAEGSRLPRCAETGAPARPCVLMFGDGGVNTERIDKQYERYNRWRSSLPRDAKLAVVEVGAGTAVPTIRMMAESATSDFVEATLVRINLDQSDAPASFGPRAISIGGLGALDALARIDALMKQ